MEHLKNKTVKTKKPHQCHGCAETYPAGSVMQYNVQADQGEILASYWCETCETVLSNWHYDDLQNGVGFGELKDEDPSWKDIHDEIARENIEPLKEK